MSDHDHTPDDRSWGRCARCGGWIFCVEPRGVIFTHQARRSGHPHEVSSAPVSATAMCQCPPVPAPAASPELPPEPAGEASEIARLQREVDALLSDERMAIDLAHSTVDPTMQDIDSAFTAILAMWQLVERTRADRDRLRDAGDRMRLAGESCIADAAEEWPDEDEIPRWCYRARDAWEAAADAWMVAREVKP